METPEVLNEKVAGSTPLSLRKATESTVTVQVKERPRKLFVKNTFKDQLSFEEFWDEFRLYAASIYTAGKMIADPLGICTELYERDYVMPPEPDVPRSILDKKPGVMLIKVYKEERREWTRLRDSITEERAKQAGVNPLPGVRQADSGDSEGQG